MPSPLLLLVEDDPDLALAVRVLCRRAGHALEWRAAVPAAREFLRSARPDLVLIDVNLPGESGLTLVRELGRARPGPALALFSHWGVPADVAAGIDAGADFVVSKDLVSSPAQWDGRVAEILAYPDGQASATEYTSPQHLPLPAERAMALRRALEEPALRAVPDEVLAAVLRRARGDALRDGGLEITSLDTDGHPRPGPLPRGVWQRFVVRLEGVLGAAAVAPVRVALAEGPAAGTP